MANTGVSGRVVDAVTKAGIPGLTVKAYDIDPLTIENFLGSATTGADGRFSITYDPGKYRIWLTGENPDIEVRVFGAGDRLLHETKKKDGVTDTVLPVPDIEIHACNIRVPDSAPLADRRKDPYWLVTHTTLNPKSGTAVRLTQGNKIDWLIDGAAMFPAVNKDVRRGLHPDGKADETAADPVKSIKLINMGFNGKDLISHFEFPTGKDHTTVKAADEVIVDRLGKILKAQAKKQPANPPPASPPTPAPVHVLVWELEESIGGDLGRRLNKFDDADELRKFFQDTGVHFGSFKSTQLLHVKFILLDGKSAYLVGSTMKQGYFGGTDHLLRDGRHGVVVDLESGKGDRGLLHDASLKVEGPCVRYLDETFSTIWSAHNENPPDLALQTKPLTGDKITSVQVLRTLPGNVFTTAHTNAEVLLEGETGVLEAYQRAIMKAEEYIYIEDQYFNSPEIVAAMKARMKEREELEVIIVLNPRPDIGGYHAHQTGLINDLMAEGRGNRVAVFSMWSCDPIDPRLRVAPVYVHSKVCIIDDCWAAIGTANVDGASLNARQWRIILAGTILELLDEGDFKAAMFILWLPLIVTVLLVGFVLPDPDIGPFMRDGARREFARFTQHANPHRDRQPPRHPEIILALYDGIAGQPSSSKVKELRDLLWHEHLGAQPTGPRPPEGWVGHWRHKAQEYLDKIRNRALSPNLPTLFPEKVLKWSPKRDFEANLKEIGVPTDAIRIQERGETMPFKTKEAIP
jgi:phosphatidylserine/phosphatidylglycerophosphate/cardiolipin synthase-like enzyme